MAVPKENKYCVVPLNSNWSDLHLEYDDKYLNIKGWDGETYDWYSGEPETDILLETIEVGRGTPLFSILTVTQDDNGNNYLLLGRKLKTE